MTVGSCPMVSRPRKSESPGLKGAGQDFVAKFKSLFPLAVSDDETPPPRPVSG
jgi:hypothetical protein